MPLTLYTFGPAWELPDASPFCIKLEAYLRMVGEPFHKVSGNPREAPKGKLPYVDFGDGQRVGDSAFIIERLEADRGAGLNDHLDPMARAHELAVRTMLEESLYHCLAYFRWLDDANWADYRLQIAAAIQRAGAPAFVARAILPSLRRGVRRALHAQGTGRHAAEEVARMGTAQLDALATLLEASPYLFGARPTIADASAYGMLVNVLDVPLASPLKAHADRRPALRRFVDHVAGEHF